jgi:hypothetical protein
MSLLWVTGGIQGGFYIIIIIIVIILVITFMHGIYSYVPETNHVYRVHCVAAVPCLQFVLHVMLFRPWNFIIIVYYYYYYDILTYKTQT